MKILTKTIIVEDNNYSTNQGNILYGDKICELKERPESKMTS